jgi:hypothetical protein
MSVVLVRVFRHDLQKNLVEGFFGQVHVVVHVMQWNVCRGRVRRYRVFFLQHRQSYSSNPLVAYSQFSHSRWYRAHLPCDRNSGRDCQRFDVGTFQRDALGKIGIDIIEYIVVGKIQELFQH